MAERHGASELRRSSGTPAIAQEFEAHDGVYKLAAERSPQVREAQIPGYTGTMFSWAPALPSGGQGGQGGSGAAEQLGDGGPTSLGSGASAPYSDEGFLVYNVGDNLLFADQRSAASGEAQPEHEAVRVRARPTSHDLHWGSGSDSTAAELELLVSFLSGEVVLWRPLRGRRDPVAAARSTMTTLCKERGDGAAVTVVRWLPRLEACFVTAHSNGRLSFYDRRRPEANEASHGRADNGRRVRPSIPSSISSISIRSSSTSSGPALRHSPCASWLVGGGAAINALAFSSDGTKLATGGADGVLTVYEIGAERLPTEKVLLRLGSYFGGVLCLAWSCDDRLLFSGGEDDMVSVWSVHRGAVVARGQGHRSWVNAVAADPCDLDLNLSRLDLDGRASRPRTHRFATGGADARLLLWEYTEEDNEADDDGGGAADPTMGQAAPSPSRYGTSQGAPSPSRYGASQASQGAAAAVQAVVPPPAFKAVPRLLPMAAAQLHLQPISSLLAGRHALLTACVGGQVKTWARPSGEEHVC